MKSGNLVPNWNKVVIFCTFICLNTINLKATGGERFSRGKYVILMTASFPFVYTKSLNVGQAQTLFFLLL
jgi:hypothetical protein